MQDRTIERRQYDRRIESMHLNKGRVLMFGYETSVHETSVYKTSVYETSVYETSVYETSVYETSVHETSVYETSVYEISVYKTINTYILTYIQYHIHHPWDIHSV